MTGPSQTKMIAEVFPSRLVLMRLKWHCSVISYKIPRFSQYYFNYLVAKSEVVKGKFQSKTLSYGTDQAITRPKQQDQGKFSCKDLNVWG